MKGTIDVDEIRDIVIGLFRLAGIEEDDDLVTVCVSDIRDAVDEEGDGDISKEESVVSVNSKHYSTVKQSINTDSFSRSL